MPEPLNALVASEQAEDIKQVTLALRRHFPGCRVEAVYSAREALEWATIESWQVIVLDERISGGTGVDILPEIRVGAPTAAIIVHSERCSEEDSARIIRAGADAYLYRPSPAFLPELLAAAGGSRQKQGVQRRLQAAEARHRSLLDTLPGVPYELDHEGRFISVGAGIFDLLGYHPEDLVGLPASLLLPPADRSSLEAVLRERRTGGRGTKDCLIRLLAKTSDRERPAKPVLLSATGCYTSDHEFLGTIGYVRGVEEASLAPPPPSTDASAGIESSRPLPLEETPRAVRTGGTGRSSGERRRSPRVPLIADVQITLGGQGWKGRTRDCSLHGLFLVTEGEVPAARGRSVRVGLLSDVGLLELRAVLRDLRRHRLEGDPTHLAAQGLAIEFDPLPELEGQVLASILRGIREGFVSLNMTVALDQAEDGQLVLEAGAQALDPRSPASIERERLMGKGRRTERRQTLRLRLSLSGDCIGPEGRAGRPTRMTTVNLSLGGMLARLDGDAPLRGQQVQTILRTPPVEGDTAEPTGAAVESLTLTAEVVWAAPEGGDGVRLVGLHFHPAAGEDFRPLAGLLDRYLAHPASRVAGAEPLLLDGEPVACRNRQGRRLAVRCDHPHEPAPGAPVVVIAPDFGETRREYVRLACSLVQNGFRVVRYDHSNHIGDSEGEIRHSRLSDMRDDLTTVVDDTARAWPSSPLIVIAAGLTGLVALRACAQQDRVRLLVLLAAVLDLQTALVANQGEDLIGAYLEGRRPGEITLFGFNVDGNGWLEDAVGAGLTGRRAAVRDLAQARMPVALLTTEDDALAMDHTVAAVEAVLGPSSPRPVRIPRSPARLTEFPGQARAVCEHLVRLCRDHVRPFSVDEPIEVPSEQVVGVQASIETQRARLRNLRDPQRLRDLRSVCLDRTQTLPQVTEYWHLLDHVARLLAPLDEGTRLLEVGCGTGHLGLLLRVHQAYRIRPGRGTSIRYIGLDVLPDALRLAHRSLTSRPGEPGPAFVPATFVPPPMSAALCLADLDHRLPVRDGTVDRVVCNLVIDFLYDPLAVLREVVRVLAPGGRLVLTHLKPLADPSPFYRTMVHLAGRPPDREEGRRLLTAWGLTNEARRNGLLHVFTQSDLLVLVEAAGAVRPTVYPAYAGQAYALVAEKPG